MIFMKDSFKQKVFYADTDAYGVVWHGTYLRWLEAGRIYFCENRGYTLIELENRDIVLPVAEINVKYKKSAKLNDTVLITTKLQEHSRCSLTFNQKITDESGQIVYVEATVKVVAINKGGKLYRNMPDEILGMINASDF